MLQTLRKAAPDFYVFALASIIAHAVILALFMFGLPKLHLEPDQQEMEVRLEAPIKPPESSLKMKPPAEPAPTKPEPADAARPKPLAMPPKQAKAPNLPQMRKPAEEPERSQTEKPPAMLQPVYKFGEKDSGKDKPVDDAEREFGTAGARSAQEPKKQPQVPAEGARPPENSLPGVMTKPVPKAPQPGQAAKQRPSRARSGDEVATTAIGSVPRGMRAGQLCVTELRRQLNLSSPPYWPDLLPAYRLDKGNVLQVRKGAFRANARWYNLEFSCEVDEAATSIVSLDFEVGGLVPRDQWKSRGFPSP